MTLAKCEKGEFMTQPFAKERPRIIIAPKPIPGEKLSISLKAKQIAYVRRKAQEKESSISQVIQAAIDVMEELDSEIERDMQQEI